MISMSASARVDSTESTPVLLHNPQPGLVIEHLDSSFDAPYVLFSVCAATQLMGSAAPAAGRLEA